METRSLVMFNDPGHGWLQVKMSDLVQLGIADKITAFSYRKGMYAYLEEDCDAPTFLKAASEAGWFVAIGDSYTNSDSPVRNYNGY